MQHLSTAFLIIALVIVVNDGGATLQNQSQTDQLAKEGKNKAVTIVQGPKYVNQPQANRPPNATHTHQHDQRPPSKPPIRTTFDKQKKSFNTLQQYYGQKIRVPAQNPYPISPHMLHPTANSVLKFPRVIPLPSRHHYYSSQFRTPLTFAASTGKPFVIKSPKFSLPVQTINGIRSDFVRPPKEFNFTTTTTTTTSTTTPTTSTRVLRTKRIWPKKFLEKMNATVNSMIFNKTETNITDHEASASTHIRVRFVNKANNETKTTTAQPITRGNSRFTRAPRKKLTTPSLNLDALKPDDWVPIIPSHYPKHTRRFQTPISKRSDVFCPDRKTTHTPRKQTLFIHSYGLLPVTGSAQSLAPGMERKKMVYFKRRRQLNPYLYSAFSSRGLHTPSQYIVADLQTDHSNNPPKFVTKIKHHHHHHHHRYIKTVEKPIKVPYKVEVPKPYPVETKIPVPVPVETVKILDRPYPVPVEKKVPYPVPIKVPQPIPVKVVEKEYVPRPYPIIHHVPVYKQVEVRVPVEKKVPYPVRVTVPVDRPVPVEKKVPYPVPVKVLVPQPYPVERKVPYPVQVKVKEPVEVTKHVLVKVPQPYPVKVPVTVEKKVPYPVEVEKRVPVYVHKPYPVEKKVPYPVRVPYPVKVPVNVPVYIHHPFQIFSDDHYIVSGGKNYVSNTARSDEKATIAPKHTVTVHGNTGFTGFQTQSDSPESSTSTELP